MLKLLVWGVSLKHVHLEATSVMNVTFNDL